MVRDGESGDVMTEVLATFLRVPVRQLVMCVRNLPAFAPSGPRRAWGLVENRAALLRVVAPPALLRAADLPPQMTATTHCNGKTQRVPRRPPGTRPAGLGRAQRVGAP